MSPAPPSPPIPPPAGGPDCGPLMDPTTGLCFSTSAVYSVSSSHASSSASGYLNPAHPSRSSSDAPFSMKAFLKPPVGNTIRLFGTPVTADYAHRGTQHPFPHYNDQITFKIFSQVVNVLRTGTTSYSPLILHTPGMEPCN